MHKFSKYNYLMLVEIIGTTTYFWVTIQYKGYRYCHA